MTATSCLVKTSAPPATTLQVMYERIVSIPEGLVVVSVVGKICMILEQCREVQDVVLHVFVIRMLIGGAGKWDC